MPPYVTLYVTTGTGWFWYNSKSNCAYISTNDQSEIKMFPVPIFRRWPIRPCFYNLDLCDAYEKQERTKTKVLAA